MPKIVTKPYGGTTPAQDKKIEACVNELVADPKFKPRKKGQTKKEAAIAVCKESILNSNKTNNMSKKAFQFKAPMLIGGTYIEAEIGNGEVMKFACEKSLQTHLFKSQLSDLEKTYDASYEDVIKKSELTDTEKEFKKAVDDGVEKVKIDSVKKKYIIEGIASTIDIDLDEERMSETAIKSMADSAKGRTVPLRNAHKAEWDADLGVIFEVKSVDNDTKLKIKAELDNFEENSKARDLWAKLKKGTKLGLSIGGIVKDWCEEYNTDLNKNIRCFLEVLLAETSITKMPANPSTLVRALTKSYNKANAKNDFLTDEDMKNLIDKTISKTEDEKEDEEVIEGEKEEVVEEGVEDEKEEVVEEEASDEVDEEKSKEDIEQFEKAVKELAAWYPGQKIEDNTDIEKAILPKVDEVLAANPLFTADELVKAVAVIEPTFGEVADAINKAHPAVEMPAKEPSLMDVARQIRSELPPTSVPPTEEKDTLDPASDDEGNSDLSQESVESAGSDNSDKAPESPAPDVEGTDEEAGNSDLNPPDPQKSQEDDSEEDDVEKNVVEDEVEDSKTERQARWMKWDKAYPLWDAARNVYVEGKADFTTTINDLAEALKEMVSMEKSSDVKADMTVEVVSKAIEEAEKKYNEKLESIDARYKEEIQTLKTQIDEFSKDSVVYKSTSSNEKTVGVSKKFNNVSSVEAENGVVKGSDLAKQFKIREWSVEPFDAEKAYTEDEAVDAVDKAYPGVRKPAHVYDQKQLVRQLFAD